MATPHLRFSSQLLALRAEDHLTQASESAEPVMLPLFEARSAEHSIALCWCCLVLIAGLSEKCFTYSRLLSLSEIIRLSQIMLHDWLCYEKIRLHN